MCRSTSGTSGVPLFFMRCEEETMAAKVLAAHSSEADSSYASGAVLHLRHVAHGPIETQSFDARHIFFHGGSLAAFSTIPLLLDGSIRAPQQEDPIRFLFVHVRQFARLTEYLEDVGFDFLSHSLDRVFCAADYMSPQMRDRLERVWKAKITLIFGLSEVLGSNCVEVSPCCYSFNPSVIPELLDCSSDEGSASSGPRTLLLTSLYPFSMATNFIRYNTGDLFSLAHSSEQGNDVYKFEGRASNSIYWNGACIPGRVIFDFFDEVDGISRGFTDREVTYKLGSRYGFPRVAVCRAADKVYEFFFTCRNSSDARVKERFVEKLVSLPELRDAFSADFPFRFTMVSDDKDLPTLAA